MMQVNDIRNRQDILNRIDWNMTPEEAVILYLEWGNNWAHGNYVIRSPQDESVYFVVNTWGEEPVIYLIRRNSQTAEELAAISVPEPFKSRFLESIGHQKGVYALEGDLKQWLQQALLN